MGFGSLGLGSWKGESVVAMDSSFLAVGPGLISMRCGHHRHHRPVCHRPRIHLRLWEVMLSLLSSAWSGLFAWWFPLLLVVSLAFNSYPELSASFRRQFAQIVLQVVDAAGDRHPIKVFLCYAAVKAPPHARIIIPAFNLWLGPLGLGCGWMLGWWCGRGGGNSHPGFGYPSPL